jgi:LEA14-like dessication related protein
MTSRPAARARSACYRALPLSAAIAIASSSACVHKPTVELDRAQVSNVGLYGVGMDVVVRINNTNSFDVMVREVQASVSINNKYALAPIRMSPNRWLPSDQNTLIAVPVVIPWTVIPGLLAETVGRDTLSYRVKGTADVTATKLLQVQRNDEPIDEEGTIPRAVVVSAARVRIPGAY